jgi:hypothetical protein
MYTLLVASNLALILQLPTHHAQDNSMASRTMDLRVATATSKATATRSRIVLRALQFTRLLCCSLVIEGYMFNIKVNILFYINTIVEGFQPSWLPGPGSESVVTWDATLGATWSRASIPSVHVPDAYIYSVE